MLQKLFIRNFRSLKNVTVDLQRVNLFIGANNSGKTNFLKAFEFLHEFYNNEQLSRESFSRNFFGHWEPISLVNKRTPISFVFSYYIDEERYGVYILEIFGASDTNWPIYRELIGITKKDLSNLEFDDIRLHLDSFYAFHINVVNNAPIDKVCYDFQISIPNEQTFILYLNEDLDLISTKSKFLGLDFIKHFDQPHTYHLLNIFEKVILYQPDIAKLKTTGRLSDENYMEKDASNMISFLDNMRDQNPEILERIKNDLNECLDGFNGIRFMKVKNNGIFDKKLGLIDKRGKIFWSDELSEGTLYFLSILSIIHQPEPPKLLLLEEPEKGIHPRRIHEVMDFIFRLAEEKEIQIILTSHNTQLVDEFDKMPESVFVFEMHNGETKIKNLLTDIIRPGDSKSKEKGLPLINYTELLGEKWFQGFLGGVPK